MACSAGSPTAKGPARAYTFALGGKTPMPEFVKARVGELLAGVSYDPANVKAGAGLYVSNCVACHGVPGVDRGGNIPNLGYMHLTYIQNLDKFIFKGPAMARGMPDFSGKLSADDVEKLKAFIQGTADAIRPKAVAGASQ
ncbi:c-type cytochrome [Cupriavidus basilensis]